MLKSRTLGLYVSIVLMVAQLWIVSCNRGNGDKDENTAEILDSLQLHNEAQENQLKDLYEFMGIISESIDSIAEQEEFIRINNRGIEGQTMSRKELKESLDAFSQLLKRQRDKIAQLEDTIAKKGENLNQLKTIVSFLNQQLEEKDRQIAALQIMLNNKNADIRRLTQNINDLTTSNAELSSTIEMQNQALVTQSEIINECYVKIGTKKELKDAGILTGSGLKKKLNSSNFQSSSFMKVDIRSFTEVPLNSKNVKILTQVPPSSYRIEQNGDKSTLIITDPTAFWSISNYLVIQIK